MARNIFLYRNQFIIGPRYAHCFSLWQRHEINRSLFLTAHPDLNIIHLSEASDSLTLLGYMIDPLKPCQNNKDILNRLMSKRSTAADLIRSTFELCGNWILIANADNKMFVFHDCAGIRSVYYTDIDKTEELWLASQPILIAQLMGFEEDHKAVEFIMAQKKRHDDYWWPGDKSPYENIKALLPNHFLDLKNGKVCRYWPDRKLTSLNESEAINRVSDRLKGTMCAAAQRFDLALGLSAGFDSRVMLAASKDVIGNMCIYNGKRPEMSNSHSDISIPQRLSKKCNLNYHYIPQAKSVNERFAKAYELYAPYATKQVFTGLYAELNYFQQQKVGATGNILEVARFGYNVFDPEKIKPSGRNLAMITNMKNLEFACEAFENWLETTGDVFNLNVYDLLYWEQRCGRWMSNNYLVFLMAWQEVLMPFNCRQLLIDLLSVSDSERMPDDYRFYKNLIYHMWPELLSEPINPKPPKSPFLSRAKNKLQKIIKFDFNLAA